MKPYRVFSNVSLKELTQTSRWVKRHLKYGAYAEADELEKGKWDVRVYCPPLHVDVMGNCAIAPPRKSHKTV
jgi:hypothetical protein